jgi:hypothetical protein
MRRLALLPLLAGAALAVAPASAHALRASDYGFQVNVAATGRAWEDTSVIQFSITPATRARITVHGHALRVGVSANTLTDGSGTAGTLRYAGIVGSGAFVDTPLTAAQRARWHARPVWIDGDVLAAHPSNPLCAQGTTLAAVRARLTAATVTTYVPAGLTAEPEALFGLHRRTGATSPYGAGVRAVDEGSAVAAVASDPSAVAAVAFSGARAALAAGAVCAVPLSGVVPTEATLRDGTYPASVPIAYAWRRHSPHGALAPYAQRWYLDYLRSPKIRALLRTSRGRDRILP